MRIKILTAVKQSMAATFARFDQQLFVKLNPPFPPVKVVRFDGMAIGDEVHLELNFLIRKVRWVSRITEFSETSEEIYFVDEGIELPFFLGKWHHLHKIRRRGDQAEIIDDIHFEGPIPLLTLLMYPFLYLQFLYRKPIYRKHFDTVQLQTEGEEK